VEGGEDLPEDVGDRRPREALVALVGAGDHLGHVGAG
jgi:hypothetical protein